MSKGAWNKISWTPTMIKYLKENYNKKTNKQLSDDLGLKINATRMKLYELGLLRMKLEYWTEEQIEFLVKNYKVYGDKELAGIFNEKWEKEKGWTLKHIEKKRKYLKLKRTTEDLYNIKERAKATGVYLEGIKKTWKARGEKPLGTIVIWDGDKYIKTAKGYKHLRVFNYKIFIGEIEKGNLINHKDNNRLNCSPENLICCTRAEHAKKNNWSKYPPELRKSLVLISRINKQLKKQL